MSSGVIFGAGSIGRGFIGQLFSQAGLEVVFVEVDPNLVRELNARGSYPVRIVDNTGQTEVAVRPVASYGKFWHLSGGGGAGLVRSET